MSTSVSDGDPSSNSSSWSSSSPNSSSSRARSTNQIPPVKYKRRRRVYERIKANIRPSLLATVHEGEELLDHRPWLGPKIAIIVMLALIFIGGIKEGVTTLRALGHDNRVRYDSTLDDKVRRRKGGPSEISELRKDEDEPDDEDEDDQKAYKKAKVPVELMYLANIYDPILPTDRVYLWHIPRSAAGTIKAIAAQCFGLLLATEAGGTQKSDQISIVTDLEGGHFVNIDTSSSEGIQHAKSINVASLPGLNFISTPLFYEGAQHLFSQFHRGRCITMMRHPVERAASLYHVFQSDSNSPFAGLTMDDYVTSENVERNWMTRFLSNAKSEELTIDHLAVAKKVLEQKCLIGLMKFKWESLRRFETYFGWTLDGERVEDCHTKLLDWNWPNKNKHTSVRDGSELWRKFSKLNEFDMKLFKHAEKIYNVQGQRLFNVNK